MVATYPGTVSPLRGLDPYGEAERDVWQGHESDRDALAKLVTQDGFRAGLLFGEQGVGKTSLVRAGLIPYLRDHGIVALACEDLSQPGASFSAGLTAFGIQQNPGETPVQFITRAVANAVPGQQFVFVVDDVDILCMDERATMEISDLFTRVISRSGGKARFLFVCASERLHVLGNIERRTGSLFPPSTRYEMHRLPREEASKIFDRILSFSGVAADPALADAIVTGIGGGGPVLPADLQLAGIAMRDLRISTAGALQKLGGPTELEEAWLMDACRATGNERSAMRLVAELAAGAPGPHQADMVIRKINLDSNYAHQALGVLEQRGVITRGDQSGVTWMLRHEVLTVRIRELTAPARAAARRAFDLLGSKTRNRSRLKISELLALRHEGIAPATPAEVDVIQRSKRYYLTILGAVAAVPIVITIIIWIALHGRVYFDLTPRAGGEHIVVRGGRAGLSSFFWLPGGYGDEVADTGLTRAMVAPEQWKKVDAHDLGGSKDDWAGKWRSLMAPQLAGLVDYANGNDAALEPMKKAAKDPEDLAELLTALRPIARGSQPEVAMIEGALAMPSPAVQRAAVAAAGAAAGRKPEVYTETLIKALISPDPELRRIAFASVRSIGERGHALFQKALEHDPDGATRRELLAELSAAGGTAEEESVGSAVNTAVAALSDPEAPAALRDRAKDTLKSAIVKDATVTATALTSLIALDRAPAESRVFAIELVHDLDPLPKIGNLVDAARAAFASKSTAVRAAALPLYAKADPTRAGGDLATLLEDPKLDKPLRVAAALAWGEVAPSNPGAASLPLEKMLKDEDDGIRAAAAEAAGKLGRQYQDKLVKMAKNENYVVRIGAARGLAASAEVGASGSVAVSGIAQLWKEKGRPRREAAKVYADLAKKKPGLVLEFLKFASRTTEDPSLHPIGVEGLCNATLAGNAAARPLLAAATDDTSQDVRRLVMACVANGPEPAKNGVTIAARLVRDANGEIRADAARVLALAAAKGNGKVTDSIAQALVQLLDDPDRDVRVIALRAISGLGTEAPKTAQATMSKMFERADEGEKLQLLRTARQIGAADLIGIAVADGSPIVRVEAVDAALASGMRAGQTLAAALADSDPTVRKAALERLAAQKDKLEPAVLDRTLALAVRDPNPELSQLALTTIARVAAKDAVLQRLKRSLASRAERERAQAAAAAIGLVDRDAAMTVQLLDPLLSDPSHDVRVAMLPALAAAYAKTNEPEKLAGILRDCETHSMKRIVVAAAFVTLARTDAGRAASEATLTKVSKDGPPMARAFAKLAVGLITARADGMTFLQELVP